MLSVLFSVFLLWSGLASHGLSIPHTLGTSHPPTATLSPFTVLAPTASFSTPFEVQGNSITYSHADTLNCEHIIEGQVLNLQGEAFDNVLVNIQFVALDGLPASERVVQLKPVEGKWSVLLPNWDAVYEVWLTDISGENPISPYIYVSTSDCGNLITLNFYRVLPEE
jgi:hypothetical protein